MTNMILRTALLVLIGASVGTWAIKVLNIHCISEIQARFAITDFTSVIQADGWAATEEATYEVTLPERAFISHFSVKMDGLLTHGEIKEKAQAQIEYDEAKRQGKAAGNVQQSNANLPKEAKKFVVKVNVPKGKTVEFNMTYQELLTREHGVYKHIINVNPSQPVEDIQVDVLIAEKTAFRRLDEVRGNPVIHVPRFDGNIGHLTNNQLLKRQSANDVEVRSADQPGGSLAYIYYKQLPNRRPAGQICILFDVERNNGGTIQTYDGYFLQSIAPDNIPVGNKNVVFVIDKSGSMRGRKISQVKKAMETILDDLHPTDNFGVILFSKATQAWTDSLVPARPQNIAQAKNFIQQSEAKGGTNIFDSINEALTMLKSGNNNQNNPLSSMVIFLTDGQATVGKKEPDDIVTSIITNNRANKWSQETLYSIHCIGFGNNADMSLLRQISAANGGVARRVYADSDADVQLEGVFMQFSSPLLRNVDIRYTPGSVDISSLIQPTSQQSDTIYEGGELVQVGKLSGGRKKRAISGPLESTVNGVGANGKIDMTQTSPDSECYPMPDFKRPDDGSSVDFKYIATCQQKGGSNSNAGTPPPARTNPTPRATSPAPATSPRTARPASPGGAFDRFRNLFQSFGNQGGNGGNSGGGSAFDNILGNSRFRQVFGGGRRKRQSGNGDFGSKPDVDRPVGASSSLGGFIERTWAYLTIQKLTDESKEFVRPKAEREEKQQRAIDLSKKYQFVSEFTSMIVVHGQQRSEPAYDEWQADGQTANDAIGDNSVAARPGQQMETVNKRPRDGKCRQGVIVVLEQDALLIDRQTANVRQLFTQLQAEGFESVELTIVALNQGNIKTYQPTKISLSDQAALSAALKHVGEDKQCDGCASGFASLAPYLLGNDIQGVQKSFVVFSDRVSDLGGFGTILKSLDVPKVFIPVYGRFSPAKKASLADLTSQRQILDRFDARKIVDLIKCDF